jgi:hypothetical protein
MRNLIWFDVDFTFTKLFKLYVIYSLIFMSVRKITKSEY